MEAPRAEEVLARAEQAEAEKLRLITVHKDLELEFDLGNLLAVDRNPPTGLRQRGGPGLEAQLRGLARDNAQLLINRLWQLPARRVDEAVVARLPEPGLRLPREKPAPRPRPLTRWQQFARLKGIRPRKRSSLVWDEASRQWRRRWGYGRARDDTRDWLIEVPGGADPDEDQFAKRLRAKKERVARNELNRLRNLARAHRAPLPSQAGLRPTGHQDRAELGRALRVAKASTASAGRFQERLPKEKPPPGPGPGRKRRFRPCVGDLAAERSGQLELLRAMGAKKPKMDVARAASRQLREDEREEAARKRKLAKGGGGKARRAKGKGRPPGPRGRRRGGPGPGGKRKAGPPGPGAKKGQPGKRRK